MIVIFRNQERRYYLTFRLVDRYIDVVFYFILFYFVEGGGEEEEINIEVVAVEKRHEEYSSLLPTNIINKWK